MSWTTSLSRLLHYVYRVPCKTQLAITCGARARLLISDWFLFSVLERFLGGSSAPNDRTSARHSNRIVNRLIVHPFQYASSWVLLPSGRPRYPKEGNERNSHARWWRLRVALFRFLFDLIIVLTPLSASCCPFPLSYSFARSLSLIPSLLSHFL